MYICFYNLLIFVYEGNNWCLNLVGFSIEVIKKFEINVINNQMRWLVSYTKYYHRQHQIIYQFYMYK